MKIKSLKLWATQLDDLAAFYRDTFGLIISARQNRFEAYVGYTRLAFHQADVAESGPYHFAINIPENQFAEGKAWLAQRVPLLQDRNGADEFDFLSWNAHACYCYDPAGNILELIARHSLDCATTEPFSARSLLGVSEIGLVTDDVRGSVNQLCQKFGLGVYDERRQRYVYCGWRRTRLVHRREAWARVVPRHRQAGNIVTVYAGV